MTWNGSENMSGSGEDMRGIGRFSSGCDGNLAVRKIYERLAG
ncbi:hypothetical protein NCCP2222_33780 [Sporosarcina sp. NCCP-2222]|nr:hypothetical protein NCCP2222_33780 [Sporosarcina sp. NCCP-2222]